MRTHRSRWAALAAVALAAPAATPAQKDPRVQRLVERQLEIAARLAEGKIAYDAGDWPAASANFEKLLAIPGLPPDIEKAVRPLYSEAHGKAGGGALAPPPGGGEAREPEPAPPPERPSTVTVTGTVTGGGAGGPAGAVVTLHRDGGTPRPTPLTSKAMLQKDKKFVPHVIAVPVGSTVVFKNEDDLFHNVFSLSPAQKFDTGLKKGGDLTPITFNQVGVVDLYCNIHASMNGFVVVVDTPWYSVADGSGGFSIKNVPPGEYEAEVQHEGAAAPTRKHVTVSDSGARLSLSVGGDKRQNPFPPDKYGKPRQQQLGY